MSWPVCEEIPWHTVGPLVERVIDEHWGPDPPPAEDSVPIFVASAEALSPKGGAGKEALSGSVGAVERQVSAEIALLTAVAGSGGVATGTSCPDKPNLKVALARKDEGDEAFERQDFDVALSAWESAASAARCAGVTAFWAALRLEAAGLELRRGNVAAVESLASEILAELPGHEQALLRRGLAREMLGEYCSARDDLMAAAAHNFMNLEAQDALERVESHLSSGSAER
ncbi:unnamed protein product, partial [Polarella glacialis]